MLKNVEICIEDAKINAEIVRQITEEARTIATVIIQADDKVRIQVINEENVHAVKRVMQDAWEIWQNTNKIMREAGVGIRRIVEKEQGLAEIQQNIMTGMHNFNRIVDAIKKNLEEARLEEQAAGMEMNLAMRKGLGMHMKYRKSNRAKKCAERMAKKAKNLTDWFGLLSEIKREQEEIMAENEALQNTSNAVHRQRGIAIMRMQGHLGELEESIRSVAEDTIALVERLY